MKDHKKTDKKLFVIDDDEATTELIAELLIDTNISLIKSSCGRDAIETFKNNKEHIFLILLDIRLPDCNGFELFDKIKKLSGDVPVISITAISNYSISYLSKESGFDSHFIKPFNLDEIKHIILSYT